MFKKVIKKLKYLNSQFDKIDRSLPNISLNSEIALKNDQIQFDLLQINQLFDSGEYIPFTRWSISPSAIAHILNDIVYNSRTNIIEFGSGASTFYIAKLIKKLELEATLVSIESNETWKKKIEELLDNYGLEKYVKVVLAPISEVPKEISFGDDGKWYDCEVLKKDLNFDRPFDLVIVDGPWGGLCKYSRYPAVPFLKSNLVKEFTVFLDDTYRSDEKEILSLWSEMLNFNPVSFNKYSIFSNNNDFKLESLPLNSWIDK